MNAMLIGIVSLRSLPQRLKVCHYSISPTLHVDQIIKEKEIAPRDSDPSFNYIWLPMDTGRVSQLIVVSDVILL
jgi:hypothetical protein